MSTLFEKLHLHYQNIAEVPARHRALLDSIRSGDGSRALARVAEHVVAFQASLLGNMAAEPPHVREAS